MRYKKQVRTIHENKALQSLLLGNSLILISLGMLVPIYALFVQKVGGNALVTWFGFDGVFIGMAILSACASMYVYFLPKGRL